MKHKIDFTLNTWTKIADIKKIAEFIIFSLEKICFLLISKIFFNRNWF